MNFNFEAWGEIKHINARKVGPDEEKVLAIDVKISAEVGVEALPPLLGVDDRTRVWDLWDEDGEPTFLAIEDIKIDSMIEFSEVTAKLCNYETAYAKARKFSFKPTSKRKAMLTFKLTLDDPPDHALSQIAEYLGEETWVSVQVSQGELDLGEKAA